MYVLKCKVHKTRAGVEKWRGMPLYAVGVDGAPTWINSSDAALGVGRMINGAFVPDIPPAVQAAVTTLRAEWKDRLDGAKDGATLASINTDGTIVSAPVSQSRPAAPAIVADSLATLTSEQIAVLRAILAPPTAPPTVARKRRKATA